MFHNETASCSYGGVSRRGETEANRRLTGAEVDHPRNQTSRQRCAGYQAGSSVNRQCQTVALALLRRECGDMALAPDGAPRGQAAAARQTPQEILHRVRTTEPAELKSATSYLAQWQRYLCGERCRSEAHNFSGKDIVIGLAFHCFELGLSGLYAQNRNFRESAARPGAVQRSGMLP